MRALLLLLLVPALALAQGPSITRDLGSVQIGPRILGEPAFAFELDALSQAEVSRPGWPVTTTRAGTANCIGGGVAAANTACVGTFGLESFPSGVNGRSAADAHTVSTVGWPTSAVRICLQYTAASSGMPSGNNVFLDARTTSTLVGYSLWRNSANQLNLQLVGSGGTSNITSTALDWSSTATVCAEWGDGDVALYRNGALVASAAGQHMPDGVRPSATIGNSAFSSSPANGSIRLLRVSE